MATTQALHEGDDIVAGADAVAEVQHFDGSLTRLDAGATAALQRIADPDGRAHVILRLGPGASWHRTSPTRVRGGQYEVRTSSASALARSATFVVRAEDDDRAWFAALAGTVIVRGRAGGMVVMHSGEAVSVSGDGSLGEVSHLGPHILAGDEWVAVNAVLDGEPDVPAVAAAVEPPVDVFVVDPDPEPPSQDYDPADLDAEGEHPWRVGLAAAVALSLAAFSVVIGRAGTAQPDTGLADDPAFAVPGPPAYATPAVTAVPQAETEALPPPAPVAEPPAAPEPSVTGKSCTRARGGVVVYNGTLHNHATTSASYRVFVNFVNGRGETVTTTSAVVADVAADETRPFRAPVTGAAGATACEVDRVEPA